MIYRRLGRTCLKVSLIGFGGIPLQKVSLSEANIIVQKALDSGINFFDTARRYTDSEQKIGRAIGDRICIIASKSRVYTRREMARDIDISLKNLQRKSVDIYQVHNVQNDKQFKTLMGTEGALSAMETARSQGKIKYIGFTSHNVKLLDMALDTGKFDTIQVIFNPLEQEATDVINRAKKLDVGTIIMKPIGGGAFSSFAGDALRFISKSPVSTIIPGMGSVQEVVENASVSDDLRLPLVREQNLMEYSGKIGTRFCRRCMYCLPCPQNINIPEIFIIKGYLDRYNMPERAFKRYKELDVKADSCIRCGICEKRCPFSLPIIQLLIEADQLFNNENK